ncbi:hypothetical protein FO519_009117, partial [Halicephalobus sp. NKZ332]
MHESEDEIFIGEEFGGHSNDFSQNFGMSNNYEHDQVDFRQSGSISQSSDYGTSRWNPSIEERQLRSFSKVPPSNPPFYQEAHQEVHQSYGNLRDSGFQGFGDYQGFPQREPQASLHDPGFFSDNQNSQMVPDSIDNKETKNCPYPQRRKNLQQHPRSLSRKRFNIPIHQESHQTLNLINDEQVPGPAYPTTLPGHRNQHNWK